METEPDVADYWNTLGVAQYHAGHFDKSVEALTKAIELREGANGLDGFFLAMAHRQLDHKAEARNWYNQAIGWMEENKPNDVQLHHLRTEAASCSASKKQKHPNSTTDD